MNVQPPRLPDGTGRADWCDDHLSDFAEYADIRLANVDLAGKNADRLRIERALVQASNLSEMKLSAPRWSDCRVEDCDLATAQWERATIRRTEFVRCRLTGFAALEIHMQNVLVRHCSAQFAQFRFGKLKAVQFEDCDLTEVDFQGTDLSGVRFVRCNLSNAQLSHTKLMGTDFRTSQIEGIRVGTHELPGAVVDHFQAAYLAGLLGIVIKDEHDD